MLGILVKRSPYDAKQNDRKKRNAQCLMYLPSGFHGSGKGAPFAPTRA
jgi:hypothetical protein